MNVLTELLALVGFGRRCRKENKVFRWPRQFLYTNINICKCWPGIESSCRICPITSTIHLSRTKWFLFIYVFVFMLWQLDCMCMSVDGFVRMYSNSNFHCSVQFSFPLAFSFSFPFPFPFATSILHFRRLLTLSAFAILCKNNRRIECITTST